MLRSSENVAVSEDESSVFSLALQNQNQTTKCYSAVAASTNVLEYIRIGEQNAAASLASGTVRKIDRVCELDKAHAAVKSLNIYLMAIWK